MTAILKGFWRVVRAAPVSCERLLTVRRSNQQFVVAYQIESTKDGSGRDFLPRRTMNGIETRIDAAAWVPGVLREAR